MDLKVLIGLTMSSVVSTDDELLFKTTCGRTFKFYHAQDCCEGVYIESIVGDLEDLVGAPILNADEETSNSNPPGVVMEYQDSFTWTFYKFATRKGYVDVRWYGQSNGYYSERVDFDELRSVL
jgi:hypothetical protein